jgi:uncharacterized protein (TIGR03437 family)
MGSPPAGGRLARILLVWLFLAAVPSSAQTQADFFDAAVVHDIRMVMNPADWSRLKANYLDNTYYPANMTWRNVTVEDIGIRSRGRGSRSSVKPGLRVDFNRYEDGQTFLGLKSVVLRNNTQDPSQMHETLSFELFRRLGLPASREAYARFYVNNEYIGLYTIVESVDKTFLKRNFNEDGGYLYSYDYLNDYNFEDRGPSAAAYSPSPFKPETHEDFPDPGHLAEMITAMNANSGAQFQSAMAEFVDLKLFLTYLAIEQFLAEEDGVAGVYGMNNFYLYRFVNSKRVQWLVWDKSNAFRGLDRDVMLNFARNVLVSKALAIPELRTHFLNELVRVAASAGGAGGWLAQLVDSTYAKIRDHVYADPNKQCQGSDGLIKPCSNAEFEADVAFLKIFAAQRQENVLAQVVRAGGSVSRLSSNAPDLRFGALAGSHPAPQSFTVSATAAGTAFSVAVSSGAGWLTLSATSGTAPATLTASASTAGLAAGDYSATLTITSAAAVNTLSLPVNLSVLPADTLAPRVADGGAVDAADFSPAALAPGSLISVFGERLAEAAAGASALPLPLEIAGAGIRISGTRAPVLFASAGQVNVQVPWEAQVGTAQVSPEFKGLAGNTITANITAYSPGIFAVVYSDGGVPNASRAAAAGDILVVYANGLGPVNPAATTGAASPSAEPLSRTTTSPAVTIGGVNAEVLFSGLSPGFVGLYQVNVRVPAGVSAGSATPLVVTIGGRSSRSRTIATR